MRVLALTAAHPYPPTGGDRLRAHHLVAGLLDAGHEVVVVVLDPEPVGAVPVRSGLTVVGATTRQRTGWRRFTALISPYPEILWARPPAVLRQLDRRLFRAQAVVALGLAGARPALGVRATGIATVIDEFDVGYRLERDIAGAAPTAGGRLRGSIDAVKTRVIEARVLRSCDLITSVSEDDARLLHALAPRIPIEVHPSGADVAGIEAVDHRRNRRDRLVLTGTLGYLPNMDAARYFATEILPFVRERRPTVHLQLIGRTSEQVRTMLVTDGVEVVGAVPDVLPYLADADLFVAPLRIGGGTRLKILEAFAAGLPVVATTKAVEGLAVENGVHALIADDAPGIGRAILTLLDDEDGRERLARAARTLVEDRYDWRRIGARFADSVERVAGRGVAPA